jgi:hypothetical protein
MRSGALGLRPDCGSVSIGTAVPDRCFATRFWLVLPSIVVGGIVLSLRFGFGTARGAARLGFWAAPPSATVLVVTAPSAVPMRSSSCLACSLTGTAFPPPCFLMLGLRPIFRLLSGYCAVLVALPGHWLSSLRCTAYRFAGPGRAPRVRPTEFMTVSSPLPSGHQRKLGCAAGRQLPRPGRPYGALLSFATVMHL